MDISCERCSTEYELDESLLASGQSKVKCTNCGFIFKVQAPSGSKRPESPAWQIRTKDGKRFTLQSFDELKNRILSGALNREDQLMRPGKPWKSLFEFTELRTLFLKAPSSPAQDSLTAVKIQNPLDFEDTSPGIGKNKTSKEPRKSKTTPYSYPPPPNSEKNTKNDPQHGRSNVPPAGSSRSTHPRKTMIGTSAAMPSQPPVSMSSSPQSSSSRSSIPPRHTPKTQNTLDSSSSNHSPRAAKPTPGGSSVNVTPWSEQGSTQHFPGVDTNGASSEGAKRQPSAPPTVSFAAQQDMATRVSSLPQQEAPTSTPPVGQDPQSVHPSSISQGPSVIPRAPSLIMEEEGSLPKKKTRWWLWFLLFFVSGFVSVGVWKWPQLEPMVQEVQSKIPGLTGSKLTKFVASGNRFLAEGHIKAYERAVEEFTKASAFSADDPTVLLGLAESRLYWANALGFQILDVQNNQNVGTQGSTASRLASLQENQSKQIQEAEVIVEKLLTIAGYANEAQILWSHVLRHKGFPSSTIEQLSKVSLPVQPATEKEKKLKAEWSYSHALVSYFQKSESAVQDALKYVREAIEYDPASVRSRLLYARILLQNGKREDAMFELATVLVKNPKHPEALSIKQQSVNINTGTGKEGAQLPSEQEESSEQASDTVDLSKPKEVDSKEDKGSSSKASSGRGYDDYIQRGDSLIERGRTKAAKDAFTSALKIKPSGVEALCGLGYVALDMQNETAAIRYFKKASGAGYGDGFIGLGDAYRKLGQSENALEAYKAYLNKFPNGSSSFRAKRQIAVLQRSVPKKSSVQTTLPVGENQPKKVITPREETTEVIAEKKEEARSEENASEQAKGKVEPRVTETVEDSSPQEQENETDTSQKEGPAPLTF